jgi:hypothetical protein
MNDGCGQRRIALGAYVLGALRPDESDEVEVHLAECAGCRDELARMVDMPAVLGRISRDEALAAGARTGTLPAPGLRVGPPAGARPTLLERTLGELGRRRRQQRLRWRAGVAAGGVAVIALAAAVAVLAVTRPAPVTPAVAAAHLSGADQGTGVRASAELYAEAWGTSIHLDVSGVTPGDQCELVVVGQDGSQQVAGAWKVGYAGWVDIDGATGISPGQISSLQIVTTSGSELVALPA